MNKQKAAVTTLEDLIIVFRSNQHALCLTSRAHRRIGRSIYHQIPFHAAAAFSAFGTSTGRDFLDHHSSYRTVVSRNGRRGRIRPWSGCLHNDLPSSSGRLGDCPEFQFEHFQAGAAGGVQFNTTPDISEVIPENRTSVIGGILPSCRSGR